MSQVNKIQTMNLGGMLAVRGSKSVKEKSDFSQIFTSSTNQTNQQGKASQPASSIYTTKEKIQNTASASKNRPKSDEYNSGIEQNEITNGVRTAGESILEEAECAMNQLKEEIAKILDISVEELEKAMAESGIVAVDLLNPEALQNVLLQVNNVTESTDLLTNEALCNKMQELVKTVEDFKENFDTESLTKLLEEIAPDNFAEALEGKMQSVDGKEDIKAAESAVEEKQEAVSSNETIITVQKEEMSGEKNNGFEREQSNEELDFQQNQLNQFIQNLTDSIQQTSTVELESMDRLQQMQNIVNQVVEKIKVTLSTDSTNMEMQLNPGNLGKVTVSVVSRNGEMTAAFTVESQLAKEALESQMLTLKENLSEQGIKVEAIEVTVAEQGLSQEQFSNQTGQSFQQQNKRRSGMNKIQGLDSNQDEEEIVQVSTGNGTVEFSA